MRVSWWGGTFDQVGTSAGGLRIEGKQQETPPPPSRPSLRSLITIRRHTPAASHSLQHFCHQISEIISKPARYHRNDSFTDGQRDNSDATHSRLGRANIYSDHKREEEQRRGATGEGLTEREVSLLVTRTHAACNPPSMTTLVASRQPLQILSMGENQSGRRHSKRIAAAAEFEQDDDFQFVRKSKKLKTTNDTETAAPPKKQGRGRPSRPKAQTIVEEELEPEPVPARTTAAAKKKPGRRKASIDASQGESKLKVPKKAARQFTFDDDDDEVATVATTKEPLGTKQRQRGDARAAPRNMDISPELPTHAKIALPMSDTPIINRNKEMRKKGTGARRSSLGSRGRRASSLIESGQSAIPHRDVRPQEFYKHIEADGLPEPRRMKQLLTWCGERALSDKPAHGTPNSAAIHGARAIQDLLLKDFGAKSDFSNWFGRDEEVSEVPAVLKPNPRNLELDEKMRDLEAKIKRLQEEKQAWLSIRKPPEELPPMFSESESQSDRIVLPDFDLLDPEDGQIRGYLADQTTSFAAIRTRSEKRLRQIQSSLEFQVDRLADNVHKLEQRVSVAGKEADKVLRLAALRLRDREDKEKKMVGTKDMPIMEVLRSLSSILPEGGG